MFKIAIFDVKESEKAFLQEKLQNSCDLYFYDISLLPNVSVSDEVIDSEIISVFTSSRLTSDVLSKFKNLKLISTRSVGFSHIDLDYCKRNGITVINTPHYGDYTIAEFSLVYC